jgi:hypothetical protein
MPWDRNASTWGVVVVHGVGVGDAGESLDAFVDGLYQHTGGNLVAVEPPQVRLLPEPQQGRFPMHVRLAQVKKHVPGTPDQAVFAEAYWGDLTKTGGGTFELVLQLLTMIFHTRYLTDRAAAYPKTGAARWYRLLLYLASFLLCGPMAAGYVFVLALLLLRFGAAALFQGAHDSFAPVYQDAATGLIGVVIVGAAAALLVIGWHWSWDRRLSLAFAVVAAVGAVFASLGLGRPGLGDADMAGLALAVGLLSGWLWFESHNKKSTWGGTWRLLLVCATLLAGLTFALAVTRSVSPEFAIPGFALAEGGGPGEEVVYSAYVGQLLGVVEAVYVIVIGLAVGGLLLWAALRLAHRGDAKAGPALDIALGSLVLQIGLWALVIHSLLLALLDKVKGRLFVGQPGLIDLLTSSVVWHAFLALIVALSVLRVWVGRRLWARGWKKLTAAARPAQADADPRLLLNPWIFTALVLAFAAGCVSTLYTQLSNQHPVADLLHNWELSSDTTTHVIVVAVGLMLIMPQGIRAALHVIMDVISHFYRPSLPPPLPVGPIRPVPITEFTLQQHIEERLRRVVSELLSLGRIERLTFVTHSQGTMITLDVLWQTAAARLLKPGAAPRQVYLITMGSPITHLYQHYFPERYPDLFVGGALNPLWGTTLTATVDDWLNLFRVDDFVGTTVKGGRVMGLPAPGFVGPILQLFPDNDYLDEPGGHTRYWNATDVYTKIKGYLPG